MSSTNKSNPKSNQNLLHKWYLFVRMFVRRYTLGSIRTGTTYEYSSEVNAASVESYVYIVLYNRLQGTYE